MKFSIFDTLLLLCLVHCCYADQVVSGLSVYFESRTDPEITMNASEIISRWGYVPEEHSVTTSDGYILTVFRILPKNVQQRAVQRPVLFLQHGLECSATDWIINLPSQSAGFYFSDQGFDVWLGNVRGNRYGKAHKTLTVDDQLFWNFTWVDIAEYDLPAVVDKALEVSGQRQLFYVGHSQGTLTFFAKASTDQQFAAKIRKMYALAPVYTLGNIQGLPRLIASLGDQLKTIPNLFGTKEFMMNSWPVQFVMQRICPSVFTRHLCTAIKLSTGGKDTKQVNATRLGVLFAHYPSGTSAKNFNHFLQLMISGKCQKYDYGTPEKNMHYYGQDTPPVYNASSITTPVALFYSRLDKMAPYIDIESTLAPDLGATLEERFLIGELNHADYTWGTKAVDYIYRHIVYNVRHLMNQDETK